jgi:hypothetical protein
MVMSQHAPTASKVKKKVGLLFVHGIGEQKRWEFLTGTVEQFAELMRQADDKIAVSVSVTDRTKDWKYPPGEPDKTSDAPVSLNVKFPGHDIDFECHEVWWADLGSRSGVVDAILFWIWGLGQWCAPIYRELDAAQLSKDERKKYNKPVPKIAKLPTSVAGTWEELNVRAKLMLAAIAAAAVAATWGLAKRLLGALLNQAPSPTIIVQYVGDVRTYEERAAPGDTALSDPGFPRRVGIRRRMITEMVAMAERGYDEWYVVAHSLGSVLAYNGLTEIGHTLPNYLPQKQWDALPDEFKLDPGCMRRKDEEIDAMMPARPAWLANTDVINRPRLFRDLKGFLTFGSPLNKFAALWPRVVATATDREEGDPSRPFADDCRWINLIAPSDPVAGVLDRFSNKQGSLFADAIPRVENISTSWTPAYVLAHIKYFAGVERFQVDLGTVQKRSTMKWLMAWPQERINQQMRSWLVRQLQGLVAYLVIVALLLLIAVGVVTLGGGLAFGLFGATDLKKFGGLSAFFVSACSNLAPVIAMVLWAILLAGLWRWFRESSLNVKFAKQDQAADQDKHKEQEGADLWPGLIAMLKWHRGVSLTIMAVSVIAGGVAIWLRYHSHSGGILIAIVMASLFVSVILQTLINRRVEPLKKSKDKDHKKHRAATGEAATHDEAVSTVEKDPFAPRTF